LSARAAHPSQSSFGPPHFVGLVGTILDARLLWAGAIEGAHQLVLLVTVMFFYWLVRVHAKKGRSLLLQARNQR